MPPFPVDDLLPEDREKITRMTEELNSHAREAGSAVAGIFDQVIDNPKYAGLLKLIGALP